ncbi:MFS transporter [Arthrobacter sp. FW306-2-2C-D06B]|uniref:MFS transporter n=1 Tax=Arthrobacter sp. FW306-2-2C-D06B TaxID=2879618 RepID=UPI001EFF85E7|nr:MFS transporter [Arthrobacter sp. FW306-2-2C-D06B]UKA60448.1 MFS transporter [Arthrobacter sp. FW306-2-2C-D06B]
MGSSPAPFVVDARARRRVIGATLIGNFMEWFDFAVYGFVATIIGATFFPSGDATSQLLSSLAVFGVAFLFRPMGGAVFGYIGDKIGRRTSLALAIVIMSVATAVIGVLPGFASIGVAAPTLLVAIRCIQGLSVGGEWTGASTFLVEYAPDRKRGLWSSLIAATAALGIIAGSAMVFLLSNTLSQQDMNSFGWRIPFLLALPIGIVGLFMRMKLEDTPVFREIEKTGGRVNPFKHIGKGGIRNILIAFAFSSATGTGFYYFATYFNNYLSVTQHFPRPAAILLSTLSLVLYAILCPLAGAFSDRFGRRISYILGCAGLAVLVIPVFLLMSSGQFGLALLGLGIYAVAQSLLTVMSSVTIVEFFPPKIRLTAGAIGYNLGVGPVAGMGPLVAAALVAATGDKLAPAYYLMGLMIAVAIVLVKFLPETYKRSLYADHDQAGRPLDARESETATDVDHR